MNPFNLFTWVFLQLREMSVYYLSVPSSVSSLLLCPPCYYFTCWLFFFSSRFSSLCVSVQFLPRVSLWFLWQQPSILSFSLPTGLPASRCTLGTMLGSSGVLWLTAWKSSSVSHSCSLLLGMSLICCEWTYSLSGCEEYIYFIHTHL